MTQVRPRTRTAVRNFAAATVRCVQVRAQAGHAAIAWCRARHAASASPIGVEAGPRAKGQISSAMARQLAVADSSPSTANRPRLMRWRITYDRGTLRYSVTGLRTSKKRRTTEEA